MGAGAGILAGAAGAAGAMSGGSSPLAQAAMKGISGMMSPGGSPAGPAGNGVVNNNLTPQMGDANAGADLNSATASTGLAAMAGGGPVPSHPMSHPDHPLWPLLHHVSGAGGGRGDIPPQMGIPTMKPPTLQQPPQKEPSFTQTGMTQMSKGGVVTPVSKMPPTGPLPANFGSARNYQGGGPVIGMNSGAMTRHPAFMRGAIQASPGRSMGQGITPASDEGQMLTMDGGGSVPDPQAAAKKAYFVHGGGPESGVPVVLGHAAGGVVEGYDDGGQVGSLGMPPAGTAWTPMQPAQSASNNGMTRGTGFVGGMGEGMGVMKNIQDNWRQHEARNSIEDAQSTQEKAQRDAYRQANGLPTDDEQQSGGGVMGAVHDHVSKFFDMLHGKSLDDKANINTQPLGGSTVAGQGQAIQAPVQPAASSPPAPAQPGAAPPAQVPGAGAAPPGAGGPPPGAAPPAPQGPAPGAAPPSGAAPVAGVQGAPAGQGAAPPTAAPSTPAGVAAKTNQGAIASGADPAQAQASATAAGDAAATLKPGSTPAQVPGQAGTPESLTHKDWEDMEAAKWKAARAATNAGMDGNQVYQSMTQLQTAHFQGQYLKWIGSATTALQSGDQDQVEKSLKAASYYLPNGKPLELHKATADEATTNKVAPGTFIVDNPFYGMPGHSNPNEPKQVPVTPMTLAAMGQAAQDPVAFGTGMQGMYKMGVSAQSDLMKAQGALGVGQGRVLQGQAAFGKMLDDQARTPSVIGDTKAQADLREAQSGYYRDKATNTGGGVKIKPSDVVKAQQNASRVVDDESQGQQVTTPALIPDPSDPTGKMMMANPHGNQPYRDPKNINPLYAGLSAADRGQVKAYAGEIAAANVSSGMTAQEAAEAGARLVAEDKAAARNGGNPTTHINPQTKNPEKNVVTYMAKGNDGKDHAAFRVWADGHYIHGWTTANVSSDDGAGPAIESGGGKSSGEGGSGDSGDDSTENSVVNGG